ncbi:MAG: hypothetical protein ACFCVE_11425 [Phycisphaerae bacterium]
MPGWPPFFRIEDYAAFFDAVETAAAGHDNWSDVGRLDVGMQDCISVEFCGSGFAGVGLYFALLYDEDKPGQVQLTLHAKHWPGDRCLPYEDAYAAAERLALSFLRPVAVAAGRRLRLCRPKTKRHLTGKVAEVFKAFCTCARDLHNAGRARAVHPCDLKRFYEFVAFAHRYNSGLDEDELHAALRRAGFEAEEASDLTRQYVVGRRMLAVNRYMTRSRLGTDVWHPWNARTDRRRERERRKRD